MSETNDGLFLKQTIPFFDAHASNTNKLTHVVRSVNDPVQVCQCIFLHLRIWHSEDRASW
jgi:hypothetical protein